MRTVRNALRANLGGRHITMTKIPIETLAEDMFRMVEECAGKKNLKAGDLTKAMIAGMS